MVFNILQKTPIGDISPSFSKRILKNNIHINTKTHELVSFHIEEYKSSISHYCMEHAPNTRYILSDINASNMHADFQIVIYHMNFID